MTIEERIQEDLKAAMIAKDEVRKNTLRGIKKEIIEAKTAPGANGEVSEATILKIMAKMVRQRKDVALVYTEQGRPELAANELAEAAVIEAYLPAALSAEELEAAIRPLIAQVGAKGPQDMGKVMGIATKALAGKAEGRAISEMVKKLLAE